MAKKSAIAATPQIATKAQFMQAFPNARYSGSSKTFFLPYGTSKPEYEDALLKVTFKTRVKSRFATKQAFNIEVSEQ